jgi:hypothetical protein
MSVSIKYALLNDKKTAIHIKEAKRDDPHLRYYCEECGGELLVRHGLIKTKHFAHKPGENLHCKTRKYGNSESIVHKYWKQKLSRSNVLEYPVKVLNDELEEEIQNVSKPVVKAVMEKEVKTDDGRILRPDILFTLEGGEKVAFEIAYKNPKSPKYKQVYRKLKLHAVEVKVNQDRILHMSPLYSLGEENFFARKLEKKMQESKENASDKFIKSIYNVVERWEKKNHFKQDVPRYVYYLVSYKAPESYLFFTTFKTYERVERSYGHLFRINKSNSLKRRIKKKKIGLFRD